MENRRAVASARALAGSLGGGLPLPPSQRKCDCTLTERRENLELGSRIQKPDRLGRGTYFAISNFHATGWTSACNSVSVSSIAFWAAASWSAFLSLLAARQSVFNLLCS